MPQQEAAQRQLGRDEVVLGLPARPHHVADRLVLLVGHPYRGEFARAQQPCQRHRVPPIRLHPVARPARRHRRRDDHAIDPEPPELAIDAVPARACLVAEPQHDPRTRQARDQPPDRLGRVRHRAVEAHLTGAVPVRHRDRDRVLVHVETDELDRHGSPPGCWSAASTLPPDASLAGLKQS